MYCKHMPQISKHSNLIIHQHRIDAEERSHWKPRLGGGIIGRGAWCDHYTTSLCNNYQCILMIHTILCTLCVVAREVTKSQHTLYYICACTCICIHACMYMYMHCTCIVYLFATMYRLLCTFLHPPRCCTRARPRHSGAHQLTKENKGIKLELSRAHTLHAASTSSASICVGSGDETRLCA